MMNEYEEEFLDSPLEPPARHGLDNSKDALAMFQEAREQAVRNLYRDDKLVREGIDAQLAIEKAKESQGEAKSNLKRNELGKVVGVDKSVLTGGTGRNQNELWMALKTDILNQNG